MLYTIYALENTRARLCVGKSTTSDKKIKDLIVAEYESRGLLVNVSEEE